MSTLVASFHPLGTTASDNSFTPVGTLTGTITVTVRGGFTPSGIGMINGVLCVLGTGFTQDDNGNAVPMSQIDFIVAADGDALPSWGNLAGAAIGSWDAGTGSSISGGRTLFVSSQPQNY